MAVQWIDESRGMLGQEPEVMTAPTPPAPNNHRLTTIEKISIVSVMISAVALTVNLWHLAKNGKI